MWAVGPCCSGSDPLVVCPEAAVQLKTKHRRHLFQVAPAVEAVSPGPVIEQKEAMGHPELQAVWSKANPFSAAELMGQQHGHVTGQLTTAALEQER